MVGVLVPIHHTGNLLVKMLVWAVEYIFLFQKKALYYLVGTKVSSKLCCLHCKQALHLIVAVLSMTLHWLFSI